MSCWGVAAADDCSLLVTGLPLGPNNTNLNGNWEYTGSHSITRNGTRTFSIDYTLHDSTFLQYDDKRNLWAITYFNMTSMNSTDLALCRSPKCAASDDLSSLGDAEPWEVV